MVVELARADDDLELFDWCAGLTSGPSTPLQRLQKTSLKSLAVLAWLQVMMAMLTKASTMQVAVMVLLQVPLQKTMRFLATTRVLIVLAMMVLFPALTLNLFEKAFTMDVEMRILVTIRVLFALATMVLFSFLLLCCCSRRHSR